MLTLIGAIIDINSYYYPAKQIRPVYPKGWSYAVRKRNSYEYLAFVGHERRKSYDCHQPLAATGYLVFTIQTASTSRSKPRVTIVVLSHWILQPT